MVDYAKLSLTAERLVEANGRDVTVVKQGKTPIDASKPWRGQEAPPLISVTGKAVFVAPGDLGKHYQNTDDTKRGEQVALFAAANDGGNDLSTFDKITDGSVDWHIMRTQLLQPASTRLLYMFEVNR